MSKVTAPWPQPKINDSYQKTVHAMDMSRIKEVL